MDARAGKLNKLLAVQGELKALHEARAQGHRQAAAQARGEAEDLAAHFDAAGTVGSLFPELYHARIAAALRREADEKTLAEREAAEIAAIALREKSLAQALAQEEAKAERHAAERAVLEWVESRLAVADP